MSPLEQKWFFDFLRRMAQGIVAVVGSHCEVVVHDFSELEHSAVIVSGDITGRLPGAPVPDLGFISEGLDADTPDQLNYRARIGSHFLQSSTIWIRNQENVPIGAVCVNVDYHDLARARDILNKLSSSLQNASDLVVTDTFAKDVKDLIRQSIDEFMRREGIRDIGEIAYESKLDLVQALEDRGLFRMRGAVNEVAEQLGVTRATIYNYRSNLKSNGD